MQAAGAPCPQGGTGCRRCSGWCWGALSCQLPCGGRGAQWEQLSQQGHPPQYGGALPVGPRRSERSAEPNVPPGHRLGAAATLGLPIPVKGSRDLMAGGVTAAGSGGTQSRPGREQLGSARWVSQPPTAARCGVPIATRVGVPITTRVGVQRPS